MATTKLQSGPSTRIDARAAANAAARYFRQLYPNVSSCSLEEVELSEDDRYWLITLGFEVSAKAGGGIPLLLQPPKTKFKVFKVNAQTGEVVSMRIRKLE